ncbi:MAG TPA: metallophosphoesterase [Amycolatopsis sp.]|uniref:metallophosphoesterase n=1 Tax=Amycolatopsis sp. TaxID=37632 RepID=UPI002B48E348|nr:metallophosphoesterase [Amycolatopsis sp.]HKS48551.1 metallophosphoesterase [Amycolatopsis sp.]
MRRSAVVAVVMIAVPLVLFGVPWWVLVISSDWPAPVVVAGSVVFAAGFGTLIATMRLGHGGRSIDAAARIGDTTLGVVWLLFTWSVLGAVIRVLLAVAGVPNPVRCRSVTLAVLAIVVVLAVVGHIEAMRVPRVRTLDIVLPRLGRAFDGVRVVVVADTHFGPIDRRSWAVKVVAAVNALNPDVVCHVGDLADGTVTRRRPQVDPLGEVHATMGKFYITGNHEYFSEAQRWLDHMTDLGWTPLHNRHELLSRGEDRLVIAGVDDPTGVRSGLAGHGPDLAAALGGTDPDVPVVLLAHQPKQVPGAAKAGIDLQISGHTHGGQIWPFHYLVRLEQGVRRGLSRHGTGTQLYTCGGAGFWGPPLRVFAPSEIAVLVLRAAESGSAQGRQPMRADPGRSRLEA